MVRQLGWVAALAFMGLLGCGGHSDVRAALGSGGSGGAPDDGGDADAGFETSGCFSLIPSTALHADLSPEFSSMTLEAWIGSQRSAAYLGLFTPAPGSFDCPRRKT
jgi:hypothetical protein